jgi:hypothetical protein
MALWRHVTGRLVICEVRMPLCGKTIFDALQFVAKGSARSREGSNTWSLTRALSAFQIRLRPGTLTRWTISQLKS